MLGIRAFLFRRRRVISLTNRGTHCRAAVPREFPAQSARRPPVRLQTRRSMTDSHVSNVTRLPLCNAALACNWLCTHYNT